VALPPAKPA